MSFLRRFLAVLAPAAIALWTGAVLTIAFLAAPLVFQAVPDLVPSKDIAGRIIGPAFGHVDTGGIAAAILGLLYMGLQPRSRGLLWRRVLLTSMLAAAIADVVYIAPAITARQEPLGTYHAVSVGLWMLILLGGLTLMACGLAPDGEKSQTTA